MKNFTIVSLACASLCLTPMTVHAKKLDNKDKELIVGLAGVLIGGILSNKQNQQHAKQQQNQQQNQQQTIFDNQEKEKFVRQIYEKTLELSLERQIMAGRESEKDLDFIPNASLSPKYMSRALLSVDYLQLKHSQSLPEFYGLDDCNESGFDLFWGYQDSILYHPNHQIDYTAQDDGTVKVAIKLYDQWSDTYRLQDVIYHLVQEDGQYKVDDIGYIDHTYQVRIPSQKAALTNYCS
ncbi:hypothetical protein [Moraxella nasicaprae]|uniref:DUF3828 domain-containing protein n=1 Tax=Moraxella nasicaprae TaxID=2904122 RepID=A0ABY6F6L2_9GAMM|nr:hypothetical protein [Moraxella nasicaprae]UXZ05739.1 hypothetical protein LU297_04725 [Moraxella nasicaprae]